MTCKKCVEDKCEEKDSKCEYLGKHNTAYCSIKDMECLEKKYGDNIPEFTVSAPYGKKIIIYGCDGIKPQ